VTDANEGAAHMVRKRTLKSGREKRKERKSRADPKCALLHFPFSFIRVLLASAYVLNYIVYHGARARFHLYQCLQLLLRSQVATLTRLWGLPPEFEVGCCLISLFSLTSAQVICREIWTLHLSAMSSPIPAEPLLHEQDVDGGAKRRKGDEEEDFLAEESSSSSDEDEEDEEDEDMPRNAELEAILDNMGFSSGSEDGEEEGSEQERKKQDRVESNDDRLARSLGKQSGPANNIVVLILACWHLRLPIIYMDFVRQVHALPYTIAVDS
jgi:RNA polymerase I-specific transcription initiation factor RRN7